MEEVLIRSYAAVLSSEEGKNKITAYQLEAYLPIDGHDGKKLPRVKHSVLDTYTSPYTYDIFHGKHSTAHIQPVVDMLLQSAHGTIQRAQSKQKGPASRHDAVPVYGSYMTSSPTQVKGVLPGSIISAIHTSGYRDGFRFRIARYIEAEDSTSFHTYSDPAEDTTGFHTYSDPAEESTGFHTYSDPVDAEVAQRAVEADMLEDFRPRLEATAVCHERGKPWSITPYLALQNRAHDFAPIRILLDKVTSDPTVEHMPSAAGVSAVEEMGFSKVYFACPQSAWDGAGGAEYIQLYKEQLAMGCFLIAAPAHAGSGGGGGGGGGGANRPLTRYAVTVDAGSSGSRVYVYKWVERVVTDPNNPPVWKVVLVPGAEAQGKDLIAEDKDLRLNPQFGAAAYSCTPWAGCPGDESCWRKKGISEVNPPPTDTETSDELAERMRRGVRHHLQPLLAFAQSKIRQDRHGQAGSYFTGLFVGATGGMRALLNQADDPRKRMIETAAQKVIREYSYASYDTVHYQTISGRVEGVFGWVTANYNALAVGGPTFATPTQVIAEVPHRGCGYLEMGGQTMQIAFHCAGPIAPGDQGSVRKIKIGQDYNVFAHCWEHSGADATWQKHRDNLYGSGKPQTRGQLTLENAKLDNCLPSGAQDKTLPLRTQLYGGYTGSGKFVECIHECLWLVGYYHVIGYRIVRRNRGFLVDDLPAGFRATVNALKKWVGTATFYHGARGVLPNNNDLLALVNGVGEYRPIALLQEASSLHTTKYQTPGEATYLPKIAGFLWRAVFNTVYTSATLHHGFGMKAYHNDAEAIETICHDLQQDPIAGGDQDPEASLRDFLTACVTGELDDAKEYTVINPDHKPWALGAAVVYAHDSTGFEQLVPL